MVKSKQILTQIEVQIADRESFLSKHEGDRES